MPFEAAPVVVRVERPARAVGRLQAPGDPNWIICRRIIIEKKTVLWVSHAFMQPSASTLLLSPIGSPLFQRRIVRGIRQPPSLKKRKVQFWRFSETLTSLRAHHAWGHSCEHPEVSPSVCLFCRTNLAKVAPVSDSRGAAKWDVKVGEEFLAPLGNDPGGAIAFTTGIL